MAENNIDDIRQRRLRRPPVSSRRLENVGLDLEVPLEHVSDEVLPLVAHETLGVGYGFDRLYMIDLRQESPVPIPLPSRHEMTKFARDKLPHELAYTGFKGHFGGRGFTGSARQLFDKDGVRQHNNAADDFLDSAGGMFGAQTKANTNHSTIGLTSKTDFKNFAKAFVGNGFSGLPGADYCEIGWRQYADGHDPTDDLGKNSFVLNPEILSKVLTDAGPDARAAIRTVNHLYNQISPSAWETVLFNKSVFTELPKLLPYLDKAFYSIYERDQLGAFKTKIRDLQALYLVLGMTEAMYAIRRGRFSRNVKSGQTRVKDSPTTEITVTESITDLASHDPSVGAIASGSAISGGVMNPFFQLMESANHSLLVAPWWLINKLNHVLYLDTDRDEEIRDVERKDITEMMTLLLEAMEVEKGLHWGSESNLPMTVFEKYKEGTLPDFSDFTDTNAALSATLLGYDSPRDAYYDRPNPNIGRVPYFHTLATTNGQLLGSAKLEFMDRIKEMESHTMLSPNPEKFKQGMQYTNAFDYTTMVQRTRFGDHSMDVKVTPSGFYRGVLHPITSYHCPGSSIVGELNLVFFPMYNWAQMTETCTTQGLLPKLMNGAAYATGTKRALNQNFVPSDAGHIALWPTDAAGMNYWQPGNDNYSALLLKSTDEMFQSWIDRGEQVRVEGAVFPTIGPVNLVAEMTYTTPMAIFQRNWPWLRKMCTYPGPNPILSVTDKSFDYMTTGDDYFGISVHSTGWTSMADQIAGAPQAPDRSGPFALEDRGLFSPGAHQRSAGIDLIPMVLPLSKTPDNWVGVFQARDAMYFLTSLLSEPIMDAYTYDYAAGGKSHGTGSARVMVYQGSKTFEGRVEDVYCTPIIGIGKVYSDTGALDVIRTVDYTDPSTTTSVYPSASAHQNNYIMFLLSGAGDKSSSPLVARKLIGGSSSALSMLLPGLSDSGDSKYGRLTGDVAGSTPDGVAFNAVILTENDFVPGLLWDKLWIPNYATRDGVQVPWNMLFAFPYGPNSQQGINYLQGVTADNGLPVMGGPDAASFDASPGYPLGMHSDYDVDAWRMIHVNWIEQVRTNLEYQRAAPSFFIMDKDILDTKEALLRASLFPLGMSTVGPLTFVGALGAEGQQVAAETVTGPSVFELSSLTLGAGSIDESPSDTDDADVGDENPSLHIADKQDV